jgi:hypothetical protein
MKRALIAGAAFLVLIGLSLMALRTIPHHIYDGFEPTDLNSFHWSERRLVAGAVKSEGAFVDCKLLLPETSQQGEIWTMVWPWRWLMQVMPDLPKN